MLLLIPLAGCSKTAYQATEGLPPPACPGTNPPAPSKQEGAARHHAGVQVKEYVARYPGSQAEQAFADLTGCLRWPSLLGRDGSGVLFNAGPDAEGTYYVGWTGDRLVAVLSPDPTVTAQLGRELLQREGGDPGPLIAVDGTGDPAGRAPVAAEVVGVRPGSDDRSLLIDVRKAPCGGEPRVDQYLEENGRIYANVVYDSVAGGCPGDWLAGVAILTAPEPIGDREVMLNSQQVWIRDGAGFRRCGSLGCQPPQDPCDPRWVHAVRDGLDVPRNSSYDVEHCGDGWLIMTVNLNSTACGAGGRPGCSAPPNIYRYFLRFETGAWRDVAVSREGGCDAVLKAEPAFPQDLCEKLRGN